MCIKKPNENKNGYEFSHFRSPTLQLKDYTIKPHYIFLYNASAIALLF